MGQLAIPLMVAGSAMQFVGQMRQAKAMEAEGKTANVMAQYESRQMERQAGEEVAASQKRAAESKRQARLVASRALALGGASGTGLNDPSFVRIMGDIEGEGAYRAALDLYGGKEKERVLTSQAEATRLSGHLAQRKGEKAASAQRFSAYVGLAQNIGSTTLASKYGGTQPAAPIEEKSFMTDSRFG